jgi:outer membrane receptor for ferrienterochelin and colicins
MLLLLASLLAFAQDSDEDAVIIVSASGSGAPRGELAVAVEVIDDEEIALGGARTVADVLSTHPGVDVQLGRFGAEVRLRGMEADQTLVLVDGVRMVGQKDGVIDLARLPIENIARIEIVKGPASAVYGSDALGGVIHIITKSPEEPLSGVVRTQVGTRNSLDVTGSMSVRREKWAATLSGGIHGADGWDLDLSDEQTNGSTWRQGEFGGQLRLTPSPEVTVVIDASTQLRDLIGVDSAAGGAVLDRTNRTEDHRGGVNVTSIIGERTKIMGAIRGAVYRDQFLVDQRDSDGLDAYEETMESTLTGVVRMDRSMGSGHALAIGMDGEWRELAADRLAEGDGRRLRGAIFAQDRWSLPSLPIVLTPGVRVEADEWFGAAIAPKLAARWDPGDGIVLRASVGQGYRAPSLRELLLRFENPGQGYVVSGNPGLQPERSLTADGGFEYQIGDAWLSASGFHTQANNLIAIDTLDPGENGQGIRFGYTNIGRARLSGVELVLKGDLAELLNVGVAWTGLLTRDLERKGPLPGRSAHRLSGTIRAGSPDKVVVVARGALTSRRPYYAVDASVDAPADILWGSPVGLVDLRVTGALGRRMHWNAGIDNVFDAGNAITDPLSPRRLTAGFDLRLGALPKEAP